MPAKNKKTIVLDPYKGRAASPTSEVRIIEMAKKIVKGSTRMELLDEAMENWGISKMQADRYYDAALRYLLPEPGNEEDYREKMQAKLLARYEALYKKAEEQGSIKAAREILDSMAKMYGLTSGNKVQIAENADGDKIINITFE